MRKNKRVKSDRASTCFVIAPFAEPFGSYYRMVLVPAIRRCGLEPLRADEIDRPGVIVNQVYKSIIDATVCLADATGRNANVMYELGIAHALGKPVVVLVQDASDLPFDLRAVRCIVYDPKSTAWERQLGRQLVQMLGRVMLKPRGELIFPGVSTRSIRDGLEELLLASSQPMFITDEGRVVLRCNHALASLVGGEPSDFEGNPFREVLLQWLLRRVPLPWRDAWLKEQLNLQDSYEKGEHPNSDSVVYFDNSEFPQRSMWKGKWRVSINATKVRLGESERGYFVWYDVLPVLNIPKPGIMVNRKQGARHRV